MLLDYSVMYEKGILSKKYLEFILQGKAMLGSVFDYLNAGVMLRTGKMNGYFNAFVPGESPESKKLQLYGFARGNFQFVGYNAAMEGGVFDRQSPYTVSPQNMERPVYCFQYGVAISWRHLSVEMSNVEISPEFKNGLAHAWGHVNITVSF